MDLKYDVVIVGAGAAGSICASEAGGRGRRVRLIDHSKKFGEKIRISGGGRCNFTNIHCGPENFISSNPHFCKSALTQFASKHFTDILDTAKIPYHEKHSGQLFCDNSSRDILNLLLQKITENKVDLSLGESVTKIEKTNDRYHIYTDIASYSCTSLVIATGGLSIPKIGATKFGHEIALQFGHSLVSTKPGLVPLTFDTALLKHCTDLSGIAVEAIVSCEGHSFSGGLLFTHRGLSGPSVLQVSSYWQPNKPVTINLAPLRSDSQKLNLHNLSKSNKLVKNILGQLIPQRLATSICAQMNLDKKLGEATETLIGSLDERVCAWTVCPTGTEGYRTAEVTVGGVDTANLSSKTMESSIHQGLYFIGEVIDVTGHLGGHNFQWAWSSGWVAGQNA